MTVSVTPSQSDIFTALRKFLLNVVSSGTEVLMSQTNRVPETKAANFVLMTPLRRDRLSTNVDSSGDVVFTGSIAATVLTVAAISEGPVTPGNQLFGPSIAASTVIGAQLSGPVGGVGTYSVTPSQAVSLGPLAAGVLRLMQPTKLTAQLDVHGPDSAENAQAISTAFRDLYGFDFIQSINPNVSPLYADDPRQLPFVNENQQVENRWVIEALLQANVTVIVPQQFAEAVVIGLIDVDAVYPPS